MTHREFWRYPAFFAALLGIGVVGILFACITPVTYLIDVICWKPFHGRLVMIQALWGMYVDICDMVDELEPF